MKNVEKDLYIKWSLKLSNGEIKRDKMDPI